MKSKLFTIALSLLFTAGTFAQVQVSTDAYKQNVQEDMSSYQLMPGKEKDILNDTPTGVIPESSKSTFDQLDLSQHESSMSSQASQAGDSWSEDFEKGNLGNFKVIKGGDPNSFTYSPSGGRERERCVQILYHEELAHDDYLITPAMKPTAKSFFSFWGKNGNDFKEEFDVLLSTTGTKKTDFTVKLDQEVTPSHTAYQKYEYNMGKYSGQTVYVAIHITTADNFQLFLDDFSFETISAHDLKVTNILPDVVIKGGSKIPTVTVYNQGENEESTWSITLTDGKGYTHENKTPGKIGSRKSITLSFPKWSPIQPNAELTATVTLASDTDKSNNVMKHKVPVITPTYAKETLYAYNFQDRTVPRNMTGDFLKIRKRTTTLSTIKKSYIDGVFAGDFVGTGDKKVLLAINNSNQKVFLINGNGDKYFHQQITNVKENIQGFTWDSQSNTMFVCTYATPNDKLYKLDENFKATFVGNLFTTNKWIRSIACDAKGNLYGLTNDATLYSINKQNAKPKHIGNLGINIRYGQEMAFDRGSRILYATLFKSVGTIGATGGLYTINTNTGKAKQVGKDYTDHVILLGTFGDPLPNKDLSAVAITPEFLPSNGAVHPQVTIRNDGLEAQANWSVRLTDGNGYNKTVKNTGGSLQSFESTIVTFDEWKPSSDGRSTLTATVILTGDANPAKNIVKQEVKVEKLTYKRNEIYGFVQTDISEPRNMSKHIVKINNNTATITSLKLSKLNKVFTGDFIGDFKNAKLLGITSDDSRVHLIDSSGNTYNYGTITGIPANIVSFTWDKKNDKMYVVVRHDNKTKLYSLDKGFRGKYVGEVSANVDFYGIATDSNGNLFGLGTDNKLHRINTTTAKLTTVGELGFKLQYAQGIGFDRVHDVLYGTLVKRVGSFGVGGLYTIDVITGKAKLVGKEYKDQAIILGTFGREPVPKDLKVSAISPINTVIGGYKVTPKVTVKNSGKESQDVWSVRLTDGKGYNKTVDNPGALAKGATKVVSFPKWSPADGKYTLTATVTLAGDKYTENNVMIEKVEVITPKYRRGTIYAFNNLDWSEPINSDNHIMNVDRNTAKISSIKATKLSDVHTGDFVGDFENAKLFGVSHGDSKVHLINGNGDIYYYKTITGVTGKLDGFTWDKSSDKIYVSTTGKNSKLYVLDDEFRGTLVGQISSTEILGIATDSKGNMFGIGEDDKLYSINKTTGKGKVVGPLGIKTNLAQDIGFDRTTDTLFGTLYKGSETGGLYTIDVNTGKATQIENDFKDWLAMLGTYGRIPVDKDLRVSTISPINTIIGGSKVTPKVTVKNTGTESQAVWSVKLTDGKGYNKTVKNTGTLAKGASQFVSFPEWSPADGKYTLTATVVLAGDKYTDNNVLSEKVDVVTPKYERNIIYAYNLVDWSTPRNADNHIMKVDRNTATISSIKATKLNNVYTGGFVGSFDKAKLFAVTNYDSKVHLINGDGETYYYKTITGVIGKIMGFTWDQTNDKIYVTTSGSNSKLYVLDAQFTGTLVGQVATTEILGIASDSKGNLFGLGFNSKLYKINKTTGKGKEIGSLGFKIDYVQDIGFDRTDDTLFGTLYKGSGTGGLYTIDVNTGKATQIREDYIDELVMLGTYGRIPVDKDLIVSTISPINTIIGGSKVTPTVTVKSTGTESQAVWSVKLTDGKGYDKTVNNPGALAKGASKVVSFPEWSPADGKYTLTATVTLTGDKYPDNNVLAEKVDVVTPKYERSIIYAYNAGDRSEPKKSKDHIMKVDRSTAVISSIKATKLTRVFAGGFVGPFGKAKLFGVTFDDNKVHLVNGDGKTYYYKTITGVEGKVSGFTWDQANDKIYVVTYEIPSKLYVLDTDFKATLVGNIAQVAYYGMASDSKGNLFGLGTDSKLYKINENTGRGKAIGPLGFTIKYAQDIGFDRVDDTLFGTLYKGRGTGGLYTINVNTGRATQIEKDFKDWLVMLGTYGKVAKTATDFASFSFPEQAKPATIDKAKHTISISVKAGTDVTKLKATFTLSEGATAKVGTVAQVSSTTVNDFTKPVTYEVTAKDGTTKQKWVVTVKSSSTPTSIDKSLAENGIAIYPNPSTGIFNVEVNEPFTIEVLDIKGRVIVESKEINGTINVKIPRSGIYFINFSNDKTSLTQRIIVSQ